MTRSFLVLFDKLPIEKKNVKMGTNSPEVVIAARCVNVGLFLSNDMRRDVEVHLGIYDKGRLQVISFLGTSLRRVSPDERSVSFFLLKAKDILSELELDKTHVMDNGIALRRTTLDEFLSNWKEGTIYDSSTINIDQENKEEIDSLYIYKINEDVPVDISKFEVLNRPRTPERFILDINLYYDSKKWP